MFFSNIQKEARQRNKNSYLKSFCIPLLKAVCLALFSVLPYGISLLINFLKASAGEEYALIFSVLKCVLILTVSVGAYFCFSVLSLGEEAWYSGKSTNKKNCFKRFMYWFRPSLSLKAFCLNFVLLLLNIFWTVIFLLPAAATVVTIVAIAFSGGIEIYLFLTLSAGALVLLVCGLCFRFAAVQRYFLARFILAENPKTGVIQSIKQSKNLVDGQISKIVRFKLTFLPMRLISLLIIPAPFLLPHYKQSRTLLAIELMV